MVLSRSVLSLVFILLTFVQDAAVYRSSALYDVRLTTSQATYSIEDDQGERVPVAMKLDEHGIWYWYRRVKTPVCQTGECKLVDVGLYWDLMGDFFGIEVYGEHLTKTDHSVFSEADYRKLIDILGNDWSPLREYRFDELTIQSGKAMSDTDAISGATRKEIASQAVTHAVYTTYTLWHLIHNGEKERLLDLTVRHLIHPSNIDLILIRGTVKQKLLLLDLFSQSRIATTQELTSFVMEGLRADTDLQLQNVSLKALGQLTIDAPDTQRRVASAYKNASTDLRLRMLSSLRRINHVSPELYDALKEDAESDNEWFSAKVLEVLKHSQSQSRSVILAARKRAQSTIPQIRNSAIEFLNHVRASGLSID